MQIKNGRIIPNIFYSSYIFEWIEKISHSKLYSCDSKDLFVIMFNRNSKSQVDQYKISADAK